MKCTNCNNTIQDDNIFCPYCGKKVEKYKTCPNCGIEMAEDSNFCPKCGYNMQSKVYICPDCGNEIGEEFQFCSVCGRPKDTQSKMNFAPTIARKPQKARENKKVSINTSKQIKLVQSIVFAVLAICILISSFFGIARIKISDTELFKEDSLKFEKDVYYNTNASDMIDFLFFTIGLDENEAERYITSIKDTQEYEDLEDFISDDSYIDEDGTKYILNKKGCEKLQQIFNKIDWLKISYAQQIMINEDSATSTMVLYKIGGVFSLCLIIASFVVFVLSILGIVLKKDFGSVKLMAILLALVILTSALFTTASGDIKVTMGVAYIFIIIFTLAYIAFKSVLYLLAEKKINWQNVMLRTTGVVMGIILLSLFTTSAVNVTIPYTYENYNGDKKEIEFRYEFNQVDLFDQYYFYYDKISDSAYDMKDLQGFIDANAVNFKSSRVEGDEFFKTNVGIQSILCTKEVYKTNSAILALMQIQPVMFLVSLISAIAFLTYSIAGLSGVKTKKLPMIIILLIMLIGLIVNIICPLVLNGLIEMLNKVDITIGLGAGVIAQIIFVVASIVLVMLSGLLKGKEFSFANKQIYAKKNNKVYNSTQINSKINYDELDSMVDDSTDPIK